MKTLTGALNLNGYSAKIVSGFQENFSLDLVVSV